MLSIGTGHISWHSKLQNEVAQLSSKMEHHTCAEAAKKYYECEISLKILDAMNKTSCHVL